MTDKKVSELPLGTPQPDDDVALARGGQDFRWTFSGLEGYLGSIYAPAAHVTDPAAHSSIIANHDADPASHGGVEASFSAHAGSGGDSHALVTQTEPGYQPTLSGNGDEFLNGLGNYTVPPAIGEANTQTNIGGGAEIGAGKVGVDHQLKTLVSGDGTLSFIPGASTLDMRANFPPATGSYNTTRANSGPDVSTGRARFNFVDGPGFTFSVVDDAGAGETRVTGAATGVGEVNTSSNSGSGVQLALTKVGFDLPFRTLSGDSMIAIAQGASTANFSISDASITSAKLVESYTPVATFTAHQGAGGIEHANATVGAAGFMSDVDKTKLDGIDAGAQINVINSWNGRTESNIVPSTNDYTAAQVRDALGTNLSKTMEAANGVAGTPRQLDTATLGGVWVPNPLQGQYRTIVGTTDFEVQLLLQTGAVIACEVPPPTTLANVTFALGWRVQGNRHATSNSLLFLYRVGSTSVAAWV